MADKKLFLLDAYALIYRAYYALIRTPMFNTSGLNTSVIFGFVNTLEEVLSKERPSHIAVAFDLSEPTFRHKMYPEYKAQREETPQEIRNSVPRIRELLEAYRIPIVEKAGFEADDVIGTLAKQAASKGFDVYMMTPDKDYAQLVDEHIYMYKPARSGKDAEVLDVAGVCERYKVSTPAQFIESLAIMGDASDNVPGVKGIGEVGAAKLMQEFGTVENLLANLDRVKGSAKDKISASIDMLRLSRTLVTICTDVPVSFDEALFAHKEPNKEKLTALFREFNFRTMLGRLEGTIPTPKGIAPVAQSQQLNLFGEPVATPVTTASSSKGEKTLFTEATQASKRIDTVPHEYHIADTAGRRQELIRLLSSQQEFCFDTETTGLTIFSELVGMSFAVKPHEAWYVPVPEERTAAQGVVDEFRGLFENPAIRKIGQNIKFDMLMLLGYGVEVRGALFDTMLAHYLIQPEQRHNMNALSAKYLDYAPVEIETLTGSGKTQMNMRAVPLEKIADYAAEDADVTLQLKDKLAPQLVQSGMQQLADTVEMPLVPVLAAMEAEGVKIDVAAMEESGKGLMADITKLEDDIYALAGLRFNIASPKQLGEVLFTKLEINKGDRARKTKTKQLSTNEEVLTAMSDRHPIVPKILEYRGLKKLLSTYVEALPKLINPHTGRIHTSYNQAVTATGRLSSTDPNLQNIPIREERGRDIRKAFIPSAPDRLLLSADYSQIELRLMAHVSGDPHMIAAFGAGADIHAATAAKIFGVALDAVTSEMRRKAKTANFGIIYGISGFGLAQRLGIPRTEAQELISGYFDAYPNIRGYMNQAIDNARQQGYVSTLMGRRRYLPEINSGNAVIRGMAERNAINAPIQGSAADIIKIAMIRIHQALRGQGLQTKMILQVHDELVFDVPQNELETVSALVRREMEGAFPLSVPLTVETGSGMNWLEAH